MCMSDPIADMLSRIHNGHAARKQQVTMPASKAKRAIAQILKEEGYISDYSIVEGVKSTLTVVLKYYQGQPVIKLLRRVSRPGLRIYRSKENIPKVTGGLGIAVVSTSKGLMTDRKARSEGHGGEILCLVS